MPAQRNLSPKPLPKPLTLKPLNSTLSPKPEVRVRNWVAIKLIFDPVEPTKAQDHKFFRGLGGGGGESWG